MSDPREATNEGPAKPRDPDESDDGGEVQAAAEAEAEPGERGESEPQRGLSWLQIGILGLAMAFLGFAVGLFVTRDRSPGEGSVDVGFYQDMISHHEQGLQMATLTLAYADDPTVRSFADDIHVFQSYEMGLMERSLQDWGYSRANRPDTAMAWMGMPTTVDQMPGMISDEQFDELRAARGAEADALFLELMASHHAGGLHMAQYAAANASEEDVRELAERMVYNQSIEINEYAQTAERLGLPVEIQRVPVPDQPSS